MKLIVIVIFIFIPVSIFAQIEITEIMYNLDGSDAGREWVEIYNTGSSDVNLLGWRIFEGDKNGRIREFAGGTVLSSGYYAIIADKPDVFISENGQNFGAILLDGAFSLKNTGEELILRNSELIDIYGVFYNTSLGGDGDGNSLQKTNTGWVAKTPTPGLSHDNSQEVELSVSTETEESLSSDTHTAQEKNTSVTAFTVEPQVFAYAGPQKRIVVAGGRTRFEGRAFGVKKEPLENVRFLWTFGDGGQVEGERVAHRFIYPGEYVVVLNASSGWFSGNYRVIVTAVPADLSIKNATSKYIEISNNTKYELDLSSWMLRVGDNTFVLPKRTYIMPKRSVKFSRETTGLSAQNISAVSFLYPNGAIAVIGKQNEILTIDEKNVNITQNVFAQKPEKEKPELKKEEEVKQEIEKILHTSNISNENKINYSMSQEYNIFMNKAEINTIQTTNTVQETVNTTHNKIKQQASVMEAITSEKEGAPNSNTTPWFLGVVAIIMIGMLGVFASRTNRTEADEYEITEEK